MVRLTRVERQARTRAAVLAAARQEFVEWGYGSAHVDRIAERAELTRGGVYSNFPSKRALYLAVLVGLVEGAGVPSVTEPPRSVSEALGAFATAWLERLPLGDDTGDGRLRLRSVSPVIEDDRDRQVLAQLARLEALLLALGLEACERHDPKPRRVRVAELAMAMLTGSSLLAEVAPGFGDPFDRTVAVRHLAALELADTWEPAHLPHVAPATVCQDVWAPPTSAVDHISGTRVDLDADGLVVVLGPARLEAVEEAVRSARGAEPVTVAIVTSDPIETGDLVRLRVSDVISCARRVFPAQTWAPLRLVIDDAARIATALGVAAIDDQVEAAARIRGGAIVARAEGYGAAHAAATTDQDARGKPAR
ncbi:TetR/AcrR family transcriptional regulator [Spiractinospora alimapuensis]|uniref:TetR/AcrR family transcriptional regulator n=1 Tax=Spiractinospora alimapuensis TaxID=2820884 RepID=UPI001F41317E|nr:TetR/AcrR family transcriptional regulator [Spiractinospora alimapuensis]QVQ50921.1 TetR/AcrR family transcriptional regulator [Spiractinospora alimapuensis]